MKMKYLNCKVIKIYRDCEKIIDRLFTGIWELPKEQGRGNDFYLGGTMLPDMHLGQINPNIHYT